MDNLTIEQKAELMDILLNDSVIKNRIDNILNSKTISTSIDEDNNIHFINNNKKIAIRLLSLNEYNKYIINGTCDGSITNDNVNVWHTVNHTKFSYYWKYSYDKDGWTHVERPVIDFLHEAIQNNTDSVFTYIEPTHRFVFDMNFYGTSSSAVGKYNVDSKAFTTMNKSSAYASQHIDLYPRSDWPNWMRVLTDIKWVVCFRPAFQIKDTNKSNNIFY